jgi:hypothetical protein
LSFRSEAGSAWRVEEGQFGVGAGDGREADGLGIFAMHAGGEAVVAVTVAAVKGG